MYHSCVPRLRATGAKPSFARLYQTASAQAGYFTASQAESAGYSRPLLTYHRRRGIFERARRGILRLAHFPPQEHEDLVVLWLWSGRQGVFSHETALLLHGISDALPSRIHLTVPTSWRARRLRLPPNLVLHWADLPPSSRLSLGPVPVTDPLRTLEDCVKDHVPPALVDQAVRQGVARGLFSRADARVARTQVIDATAAPRPRPGSGPSEPGSSRGPRGRGR